jgi:hypothetical protein
VGDNNKDLKEGEDCQDFVTASEEALDLVEVITYGERADDLVTHRVKC